MTQPPAALLDTQALAALGPLLSLGGGCVLLMLLIAARRSHGLQACMAAAVLLLALAVTLAAPLTPELTPLLRFDAWARALTLLFVLLGLGLLPLFRHWLRQWPASLATPREEAYLLLLLAVFGAAVLGGARHAASLLLGLETMTLALFALVGYPRRGAAALEATLKYLLLSAAASATLLLGMALLYAATGRLDFAGWVATPAAEGSLARAGGLLLLAGLGFKLSLVPFHLWTPEVYAGAPAPVSATLSALAKAAVVGLLLRLAPALDASMLAALALLSIVGGNLLALRSTELKRLLAFSSIAQLGYLLVPLLLGGALAGEAVWLNLAAYGLATLAAFALPTLLPAPEGGERQRLAGYRGLYAQSPALALLLALTLLSLAGIPLTLGFPAKLYVLLAAVEAQAWWLLGGVLLGSAVGLYYYLRWTLTLFAAPEPDEPAPDSTASAGSGAAPAAGATAPATPWGGDVLLLLGVLALGLLGLGLWPQPLLNALTGL